MMMLSAVPSRLPYLASAVTRHGLPSRLLSPFSSVVSHGRPPVLSAPGVGASGPRRFAGSASVPPSDDNTVSAAVSPGPPLIRPTSSSPFLGGIVDDVLSSSPAGKPADVVSASGLSAGSILHALLTKGAGGAAVRLSEVRFLCASVSRPDARGARCVLTGLRDLRRTSRLIVDSPVARDALAAVVRGYGGRADVVAAAPFLQGCCAVLDGSTGIAGAVRTKDLVKVLLEPMAEAVSGGAEGEEGAVVGPDLQSVTRAPFYDPAHPKKSRARVAVPLDPKIVKGNTRKSRTKGRLFPIVDLPLSSPGEAADRVLRLLMARNSDPSRFLRKRVAMEYTAKTRCSEGPTQKALELVIRIIMAEEQEAQGGPDPDGAVNGGDAISALESDADKAEDGTDVAEDGAEVTEGGTGAVADGADADVGSDAAISPGERAASLLEDYATYREYRSRHASKLRRWEAAVRSPSGAPQGSKVVHKRGKEVVRIRVSNNRHDFPAGAGEDIKVPDEASETTRALVSTAK